MTTLGPIGVDETSGPSDSYGRVRDVSHVAARHVTRTSLLTHAADPLSAGLRTWAGRQRADTSLLSRFIRKG
jgi:hypothetical protein